MHEVRVYRVEKEADGSGPYFDRFGCYNHDEEDIFDGMWASHTDEKHKSPGQDNRLEGIDPDEQSVFMSVDDLTTWFHGYIDTLHDAGYRMAVYTVPSLVCRIGDGQAVAKLNHATSVHCVPLRDRPILEG